MAGSLSAYEGGTYVLDLLTGNWTTNSYGGTWELAFNGSIWVNQLVTPYTFRASTVGQTTTGTLPRLFAAEAGNVRVRELEIGATDAYAVDVHPITGTWLSHVFDMGLPTREKRIIHLECVLGAKAGTTTAGSGQLDLYMEGASAPLQSVLFPLTVPTGAGSNLIRVFTRAVGAARGERFQLRLTTSTTATDIQILNVGLTYVVVT